MLRRLNITSRLGQSLFYVCYRCHQFICSPDSPSAIRQANAALSDPKYAGARISRADLQADSDQDLTDDDESVHEPENSDEDLSSQESEPNDDGAHIEHRDHAAQQAPTSISADREDTPRSREVPASDLTSALRATREQDRKKGKAVVRQIVSGRVPTQFRTFG